MDEKLNYFGLLLASFSVLTYAADKLGIVPIAQTSANWMLFVASLLAVLVFAYLTFKPLK